MVPNDGCSENRYDGILEVRFIENWREMWRIVCSETSRKTVIWQTHSLSHSGANCTVNRVKLTWHWPGIVAETRQQVKSCEVCQMTKRRGKTSSQRQQHLYAGRVWQKVAIDLVGPMPEMPKGNKWILVITDHSPGGRMPYP